MSLLPTRIVTKPWGRFELAPPFINPTDEPVGEIWFEPPPCLDRLLAKYIFTSQNLSVQCHPSDEQTLAQGLGSQGKEECWLILDADPGARLAIGFHEPVGATEMRRAALDGSIEDMLAWHPVQAGDFFYIPANTVHAIGAGITLVEIQQNSDITYRLYDYGRPRELHLEEAIAVACGLPYETKRYRRLVPGEATRLVNGPHFCLDRVSGAPQPATAADYRGPLLVLPLDCTVAVNGTAVGPGFCAAASHIGDIDFPEVGVSLLAQ